MLPINITKPARKALETFPTKHSLQVVEKIESLAIDPEPQDSLWLKGKAQEWRRVTCGEYRIIYQVKDDILVIAAIGRRNDDKVYRDFERKL